jgi:hypothetical protein
VKIPELSNDGIEYLYGISRCEHLNVFLWCVDRVSRVWQNLQGIFIDPKSVCKEKLCLVKREKVYGTRESTREMSSSLLSKITDEIG